jgi:SOS-response transcriptional repressor LexA
MLTERQIRVLDFLIERHMDGAVAPSLDEIAADSGIKSKSGAFLILRELEERGFIRRMKARRRAIEIIKYPRRMPCLHCNGTGVEP